MPYQESNYKGDSVYKIECTGDCCIGDEVSFDRATFSGSIRSPKFTGFERITGKIIRDSYGDKKQQHTFTLVLGDGNTMRIKGRNLYANGTYRKEWKEPEKREVVLKEKHERGAYARAASKERKKAREQMYFSGW